MIIIYIYNLKSFLTDMSLKIIVSRHWKPIRSMPAFHRGLSSFLLYTNDLPKRQTPIISIYVDDTSL